MKIAVGTSPIAPVHSAAFLPRSYNPKVKVANSTARSAKPQLPFFMVLSALITTDNLLALQKTESKGL